MGPYSPAFRHLFSRLGWEVVVPDRPTQDTLSLGFKNAPEFFCVPFKITLGTYIEALEQGAEVLVTTGGVGPCRAGHYAQVQADILRRKGYAFDLVVLEPIARDPLGLLRNVRRLNRNRASIPRIVRLVRQVLKKIAAIDQFGAELRRLRPRELRRGSAEAAYDGAIKTLDAAETLEDIEAARRRGLEAFQAVARDPERPVLRIGLVGEIYVVLEPASNLDIEKMLGEMGAEVQPSITLSGWTAENVVTEVGNRAKEAAGPYLGAAIGGHGQESVGNAVLFAKRGFDGLVQLAPFTCIPEIVARGILPAVSRDLDLPVLSFFLDEQTGEAGVRTRCEAFVDMLWQRRRGKEGVA
ncbi:MAG TPA: CoA protein activase [Bacillota bacterium]|jgi:predicted nucleotide-binding protein (sugar kinase/HSP70/actin superfamily)